MNQARLILNATALFITAAILEMTLHECGHFIAGLVLGMKPVLHHNYVRRGIEQTTAAQGILFASAGPALSLMLGLLTTAVLRSGRPRRYARLFLWYLAFSGFVGFFGYLMIAPFFSYGDTGYVLRALDCPVWGIIVLSVVGLLLLLVCIRWLAPFPVSLMNAATAADPARRGRAVAALTLWTLLAGVPVTALLNLPTPSFLSILAPLMSPWSLMYAYAYYLRGAPFNGSYEHGPGVAGRMPEGWWLLFALVVGINRLLVAGWSFG